MKRLTRLVVPALLAVLAFPALSFANTGAGPAPTAPIEGVRALPRTPSVTAAGAVSASTSTADAAEGFAAREQQSKQLADFRGGGVYIYAGSGATLVLVIVLLVILL